MSADTEALGYPRRERLEAELATALAEGNADTGARIMVRLKELRRNPAWCQQNAPTHKHVRWSAAGGIDVVRRKQGGKVVDEVFAASTLSPMMFRVLSMLYGEYQGRGW